MASGGVGRWRYLIRTIRVRVLAIVIIPSVALLVIGVGAAGYLVHRGNTARQWAAEIRQAVPSIVQFTTQVAEERRLSLLALAGDTRDAAILPDQRRHTDAARDQLDPTALHDNQSDYTKLIAELPGMRAGIDTHRLTPNEVYGYYNDLLDLVTEGLQSLDKLAPDAASAADASTANALYGVAEAMSRSNALAAAGVVSHGLSSTDLQEFSLEVGRYHGELSSLTDDLTPAEQATYDNLVASPAWRRLAVGERTLIERGLQPLGLADWQAAASQVSGTLLTLWADHQNYAVGLADAAGRQTFVNSLWAGGGVLVVAIVALLLASRVSARLIRKLRRLRRETLELAEERLPGIVARIRNGERVKLDTEVPAIDLGFDEIGQVASAFNRAQRTAVAAAIAEAETRDGIHAVFLNIAHRSQVVVHRQLAVLDKAERKELDPDQLALLFQLDHLATRARRNAENLIILGGEQPGRQWRNPVALAEIVRGAVGETEQYARVRITALPELTMIGTVVADLVHLLAELVDNATTFSPPDSEVVVHGRVTGEGIVIEVDDPGLGIPPAERERLNRMLAEPPDFSVMALSDDSRLGMFVVARLAARHGILVTLTESAWGGTNATVVLPTSLISSTMDSPVRPLREDPLPRREQPAVPLPEPPEITLPTVVEQQPAVPPQDVTAGRPPLPRRRRQASLSPRLADDPPGPPPDEDDRPTATVPAVDAVDTESSARERTPEQARNTMAAFQRGTRRARETNPDSPIPRT